MALTGIFPALLTPFKDGGGLDLESFESLVRRLASAGVHGFYLGGTSAELFALTVGERMVLTERAREHAGGLPVIAHVGAMSVSDALTLARHAGSCGCAAISSIPPFYCKYTREETAAYYCNLANAAGLPILVYNIPAFTGINMDPIWYRELLATGVVGGVKHTSHNLYELERLRAVDPTGTVLSGYDEIFCGAQVMGAGGCIGTSVNLFPEAFLAMKARLDAGRVAEARAIQARLNAYLELFMELGFFPSVKYLATLQGIAMGDCRPPFLPLDDTKKARLEQAYLRGGLDWPVGRIDEDQPVPPDPGISGECNKPDRKSISS